VEVGQGKGLAFFSGAAHLSFILSSGAPAGPSCLTDKEKGARDSVLLHPTATGEGLALIPAPNPPSPSTHLPGLGTSQGGT
jgi:hypothetical protein